MLMDINYIVLYWNRIESIQEGGVFMFVLRCLQAGDKD
jgi:hypothetical protein